MPISVLAVRVVRLSSKIGSHIAEGLGLRESVSSENLVHFRGNPVEGDDLHQLSQQVLALLSGQLREFAFAPAAPSSFVTATAVALVEHLAMRHIRGRRNRAIQEPMRRRIRRHRQLEAHRQDQQYSQMTGKPGCFFRPHCTGPLIGSAPSGT